MTRAAWESPPDFAFSGPASSLTAQLPSQKGGVRLNWAADDIPVNLALVPCRLPTRRFQFIRGFCSRDDRVYRCVQRLIGGWISRHHDGLRHADSSLDFALHGFFWPNPVQDREQSGRN